MARETKSTSKVHQNEELKLLHEGKESTHPLLDSIYEQSIKMASTNVGQFVIRRMDKLLWIIENTAKWSVPQLQNEAEANSEKPLPPPSLVRPLPWLFFIPALIAMRFLRAGLSIVLLMLGKESVQPSTIVHFIQIRRRKLRAIKYQGLKVIRTRNAQQHQQQQTPNATLLGRVTGVFSRMMCTSSVPVEDSVRVVVGKSNKSSIGVNQSSSKRRHDADGEESEENDETKMKFSELLEKYVHEESDEDSNFEIDEESESGSSSSSNEPSDTEDAIDKKNEAKPSQNGNAKELENGNVEHQNGHHNHNNETFNVNGTPPGHVTDQHVQNSPKKDVSGEVKTNHTSNKITAIQRPSIVVTNSVVEDTFYSPLGSPNPEINHENNIQFDHQQPAHQGHEQHHNDHAYHDQQNHNENNPDAKYYHSRHIHNRNHNHHPYKHHNPHHQTYNNQLKYNKRAHPQYNLGAQQSQPHSNGPIVPNTINDMNDDKPSETAATSTTNQTDGKPKTTQQSQSRYNNHNQKKSYHKKSSKNKH